MERSSRSISLHQLPSLSLRRYALFPLVALLSASSVFYCHRTGILNLHYDGVARLNIARRVFDHVAPHYSHLGTVWLPLQHLLLLPLVQSNWLWTSGLAGSFISAIAFMAASRCLYLMSCKLNGTEESGIISLAVFALNPNILYLQSTPLSEMLYVALFLTALLGLLAYTESLSQPILVLTAVATLLASLTRYDGWLLIPLGAIYVLGTNMRFGRSWRHSLTVTCLFGAIAMLGVGGWCLYNEFAFGSPIAFLQGPYATRENINRIVAESGMPNYPPFRSLIQSALYYGESVRLTAGSLITLAGTLGFFVLIKRHRLNPRVWILGLGFLIPPAFYVANMMRGTGIIFVPNLPPFGILNVRYATFLFPALCVCIPAALDVIHSLIKRTANRFHKLGNDQTALSYSAFSTLVVAGLALSGALQVMAGQSGVAVYREAYVNGFERRQNDFLAARFLRANYDGERILMDLGQHGIIPQQAGIPLIHFINESTAWGPALSQPSSFVQWVVIQDGDGVSDFPVSHADLNANFEQAFEASSPFEKPLRIYRKRIQRLPVH